MNFKKHIANLLVIVMLLTLLSGITVSAENEIKVSIDGSTIAFDQSPILINDRTMVPMRAIFEKLGAAVGWDAASQTVVAFKNDKTIILTIGSYTAEVNDKKYTLDTAPVLTNGRTLIPVRFVSESLGCNVEWIESENRVKISTSGVVTNTDNANNTDDSFVPNDEDARFVEAPCTADAYVKNGDSENKNFGSAATLEYKATEELNYSRKVFLRFDASNLTDSNITNGKIKIYCADGESLSAYTKVSAYEVNGSWDEAQIAYKNAPELGKEIGTKSIKEAKYHEIDITQYLRDKVASGDKIINVALYDTKLGNKRLNFESREGTNKPMLSIKYGGTPDVEATPEPAPKLDVDPLEYAKQIIAESGTEVVPNTTSNAGPTVISSNEIHYKPAADAFIRNDDYANTNFGADNVLCIKSAGTDKGMSRRIFMKFDLSDLSQNTVGGAFIQLRNSMLQDAAPTIIKAVKVSDDSWDEKAITWSNAPKADGEIASVKVSDQGLNYYLDITSYVNESLANGDKVISFTIDDTQKQNIRVEFDSKESTNSPILMIMSPGEKGGSVPLPKAALSSQKEDNYKYIEVGVNKNKAPRTEYTPTKTRILESLTDYTPVSKMPELSKYGGLISKQQQATGYFYTKKIDDRWWMIDPEGYQMINIGLVALSPGGTPRENAGLQKKYGTPENWANQFTTYLRDDLGFNGAGAWSSEDLLRKADKPFPYTKLFSFVVSYADQLGTSVQQSGHKGFVNDTMPVFDPGFVAHCDEYAKQVLTFKDDPYLIGYFSDNELPNSDKTLDNFLKLDPSDPGNIYSYTATWEWLRARHGANATISSISGTDRDDFREFVYDRYFQVVSKAIKKYDPNHMYFGSRYWSGAKTSKGMHKAAGRYCDAVSFNYYSSWSPSLESMAEWESWSGKPIIVTEWYAKGMDSGLANTSGAGWIVATQKERGYFYQNFALGLLESKSCVGFHWFKYHDNDPTAPAGDPSNVDGNKGIIDPDFNEYTALTDEMRKFNRNVYGLIDYFDNKN